MALLLLGRGAVLCAQRDAVTGGLDPATVSVRLGQSAVSLHGPWRFQVGDDPRWALPGFDDASWETVDLGSPDESGALAPGWTTLGHPGYAGFAWYRLSVNVDGAQTALELKMPDAVDDAYQIFVNGHWIGEFGEFGRHGVRAYAASTRGFPLPANHRNGPMLIAIRVWMDSATRFIAPDAGGLRSSPVLGLEPTVAGQVRLDWDDRAHEVGSNFLELLVLVLALVVAITHFVLAPHERAYLWLGLVVFVTLLANIILLLMNFTTLLPQTPAVLMRDALLAPARIGLWIFFWASWFGLSRTRSIRHFTTDMAVLLAVATAMLRPPLHGQLVSLQIDRVLTPAVLWLKLGLAVLLMAVAVKEIKRNLQEGLLALPVILLAAFASYQHELHLLHIPVTFYVRGFMISVGQISTVLSLLLVTAMGSRRFLLAQRRKMQWQLEIEQAKELQRVIIPSKLPSVPGFQIEGDYRPSREVGGDFFQIIPDRKDGSVLVLVGDVTGKGLRAGMMVALIIGTADTAASESSNPVHVLEALNERLCERGYSTATCLALKITASGLVTVANAGHLPPYFKRREVEMEGALPLGTLPGMDYTTSQFQMEDGDSLVLMTDGVVEAQDKEGRLMGFEQVAALIEANESPHAIADAAAAFGQEDDILVLKVERRAEKTTHPSDAARSDDSVRVSQTLPLTT